MKSKWKRLVVELLCLTGLFVIFSIFSNKVQLFSNPDNQVDFQFSIITIVSVFSGFSFSVLGVLISLSSTETIDKLKETDYLSNNCSKISKSIVFFLLSIFISLFFILGLDKLVYRIEFNNVNNIEMQKSINYSIYVLGILYMITGITYFAISVYNMVLMMNYIFEKNKKKAEAKVKDYKESVKRFRDSNKDNSIDDWDKDCF